MKKNILIALILISTILILTGCKNNNIDSKLIGTWECDYEGLNSKYVFNEDKTGSQTLTVEENSSTNKYTYETKENKILITYENDTDVFELGYRFDNNDLGLKDTFDEEFSCQKQ